MNNFDNNSGNLLFEIFSEEIPARMQLESEKQLERLFKSSLSSRGIGYEECFTYSGPRHLSLIINNIELTQKDKNIEIRGPRVGSNEKALTGFLKSKKINISDTFIKKTKNGDFYFFSDIEKGKKTSQVLPVVIEEILKKFVWPKSQRWSNTTFKWARPLRNILLLLNDEMVKGKFDLGNDCFLTFNNFTFGHRYNNKKIILKSIRDYEILLKKNHVLLDRKKRKQKILHDIGALIKNKETKILEDEILLNEVLGLAEFPSVLEGSISEEFMSLPREVLSTAMRVHQKYFSIIDKNNNLLPKFLFISNSLPDKVRDSNIIKGNERVLKARLSDAKFFWNSDKENNLEELNEKLKNVQFHEGLGSLNEKTKRMSKTSVFFSKVFDVNQDFAKQASLLSKADLISEMVGEFPELQGIMGGYYSQLQGQPKEVSDAIFDHYKPKGLLDTIPRTKLGCLLSIIDKIDTLTGFFIINKQPTGSKDPFALRRTGFAIVQILINHNLNISINDIFVEAFKSFGSYSESTHKSLNDFIIDKIKFVLNQQNISLDIIDSVMSLKNSFNIPIPILIRRINLLENQKNDAEFKTFLIGFKRVHNVLNHSDISKFRLNKVNETLFKIDEERELFKMVNMLEDQINKFEFDINSQNLIINQFLKLDHIIEAFFEKVIVNDNNERVKFNRLSLLNELSDNINKFFKFNLILV
ncbi:glycine--tRNA ligase subunit beta [Alphaproteobacteria bacterium]|nr:glycine--tRNA ligase subunit beta [Alphaproteobacteria bacterium]